MHIDSYFTTGATESQNGLTAIELWLSTGFLFLILLLFRATTGFSGLYGQDAYEYLRYATELHTFFLTGNDPGDYFWPVMYPITGALFGLLINNMAFALQLISMLAFCLAFFYLNKIIISINGSKSYRVLLFTIPFFFLAPIAFRSSVIVMSDILSLFFCIAAIYHCLKFYFGDKLIHLLAATAFGAAAIMTRYPAGVIIAVPVMMVALKLIKSFKVERILQVIVISAFILLPHVLIRWDDPMAFAGHTYLENWSLLNWFRDSMINENGVFEYQFINIIHAFYPVFHPGFIFPGLLLLFFIRKPDFTKTSIFFIVTPAVLYILFIAGLPYQNIRYLLLAFPFVLIFFFPAFLRLMLLLSNQQLLIKLFLLLIIPIQLLLCYRAFLPVYELNRLEEEIAGQLEYFPHKNIISFGMDIPMIYHLPEKNMINFLNVDPSEDYEHTLLLFNENYFLNQYNTTEQEQRWLQFKSVQQPKVIMVLDNDWKIYELER